MATMRVDEPRQAQIAAPRFSLETAGLLMLLLGAWGGVVPFVGPLFGFSADGSGSWHWDLAHALLFVTPGAVAAMAGVATMVAAMSGRRSQFGIDVAAIITAIAGAWFVVGPLAWPVFEHIQVFRSATPLRNLTDWIGYSVGPGALLMAFGAFAIGRARFQRPTPANGLDAQWHDQPATVDSTETA